ncbi:MAG: hypothetical protein FWC67_03740 [Defluviitaleaceae bacterium]|nr:hypothetical protein [Defluviitaleaceae bacterium]
MRFKTVMDTSTVFFVLLAFCFPVFLGINAYNNGMTIFAVFFGILAGLVVVAAAHDVFFSAYIFEDDYLFYKANMGREKIKYSQINEVATRTTAQGKFEVYMDVGRRFPHKVRVKDKHAFLAELFNRKPELAEGDDHDA